MPVVTLGLNHESAPLTVREQVVLPAEMLDSALSALAQRPGVREAAVLSTCNRTEIYAVLAPEATPAILHRWLAHQQGLSADWLEPYLYVYEGRDAVVHLLRVAAGLDSLVLGEPQILGQAKLAYRSAADAGLLGQILDRLFQHAFSLAKRVRTETVIGTHPVSVAFAAVTLARQIFDRLDRRRALLIGAGEMIELTARHFREQGMGELVIANRSHDRAEALASTCGGTAIGLDGIDAFLPKADIIISCTASNEPVVSREQIRKSLRKRRHEPVFIVDLAVPRDIEASVDRLEDVYLYTVDDLRNVIDRNQRSRAAAAEEAEKLVDEQAERFMDWIRTLDAVSAIRRYRLHGEHQRDYALEQARREISAGQPPEQVLEALAHRLTRKLLHLPTMGLRDAARSGDPEIIRQSHRLLGLDDSRDDDDQ
ncbi:glutamyl-tRNA reductase [Spiribacter vilamensis]|uniref:Glutamyl-tRNA reductase n=1 Tax=Spiribacter vilamensis TaxID=531306 RepID=A0A4Q8CYA6_9GAMM|nr:glutamyl-tRNA reductase [Spiribacter vilamensis]RZU97857.1 glutamyl-tRNA reductase [Spiribacter vilamensis]TVO61223.1 glutamyl-tRNA reductase [Spiribacter vilamensis]